MAGARSAPASALSSPDPPLPRAFPSWHFPGPSSVFHRRDKDPTRLHRRDSSTTPVAPALSTERRAQHRRVKSSAVFAGALDPLPRTPATSEKSRSPLSRFASGTSATMPATGPLTPSKSVASSRPTSKLQDSPFSDYFTDDGRSLNDDGYTAPSPEAHRMLLRLNKLQSQIMRAGHGDAERETLSVVGKRLDSMDLELDSLHSQTRMPPELEDSGLFLDEDERDEGEARDQNVTPSGLGVQYARAPASITDVFGEQATKEEAQAEYDYLLIQAQEILANVCKAQEKLEQRCAELRELNDAHATKWGEREREMDQLEAENEGLRLDSHHDHHDLQSLKLQLDAMEVELDALGEGSDEPSTARDLSPRRSKLREEIDRWRADWHDVDVKMKKRRSRWGLVSPQRGRRGSHAGSVVEAKDGGESGDRTLDPVEAADDHASGPKTPSKDKPPSTPARASTGTQTDLGPLDDGRDEGDADADSDCAITTSSEAGDSEGEGVDAAAHGTPVGKKGSAWQDLWEGLSSLAGMGEGEV